MRHGGSQGALLHKGTVAGNGKGRARFAALLCGALACHRAPSEVALEIASVGESMSFDKKELRAPAGSKVTLTLVNNAQSPVMTHNWVLVAPGKVEEVGQAAATLSGDTDYIPPNPAVLAHTRLAKPGESVSITFIAPPKGSYEFLCSSPGHYNLMKGTFTAE